MKSSASKGLGAFFLSFQRSERFIIFVSTDGKQHDSMIKKDIEFEGVFSPKGRMGEYSCFRAQRRASTRWSEAVRWVTPF